MTPKQQRRFLHGCAVSLAVLLAILLAFGIGAYYLFRLIDMDGQMFALVMLVGAIVGTALIVWKGD